MAEKKVATKKAATKKAPPKKKVAKKESRSLTPTESFVAKLNKNRAYSGKGQIRMAREVQSPYWLRRPTGLLGLDVALGGGFHAGGMGQISGAQSAGKTLLKWTVMAQIQKHYGSDTRIVSYETEMRPDKGQARLAGLHVAYSDQEIAELEVVRLKNKLPAFTDEEIADLRGGTGDILFIYSDTAETGFSMLAEALQEGIFQLAAIDSLGALLTRAQDEKEIGERTVGGPSQAITVFTNKVAPLFNLDRPDGSMLETTLLGINQVRSNIGGAKWEESEKEAMGAWSWKHFQLTNVWLYKSSQLRVEGQSVGHMVRWKLKKAKCGAHEGPTGEYEYYHFPKMEPVFWADVQEHCYGGIGFLEDLAQTAKKLGVIKTAGAWLEWPEGDLKFQGANAFAQHLAEHDADAERLREVCLKKANMSVRYN